ncbi:MAG TPA: hypothetical protein ENJ17_04715 [Gammaproteobacteria bacterium]|nr:hypothetical protein [Gammaproteobacteria bacterium]
MTRPLRIDFPGAWHHVMHWSQAHRPAFPSPAHRSQFLALLREIDHDFSVEVHAYCLMDDGYQLLLRTPRANLSRAMRHLNGVYTQIHNRMQGTDGSLFRGRFKSIVVDGDTYLGPVTRYIHRWPADTRRLLCPERYDYSSYPAYLGSVTTPEWLHVEETLALFGERHRHERYRGFVEAGVDEELKRFYANRRVSPVLGARSFCKRIGMGREARSAETSPAGPNGSAAAAIDSIIAATAQYFDVDARSLCHGRRGKRNLPRAVAMALCHQSASYSLEEVAQAFGVTSLAAISLAIYRLKARQRDDPSLCRDVETLRRRLFP